MRFLLLFLILLTAQLTIGQRLLDSLYKQVRAHPQQDTARVDKLNELSLRILKNTPEKSFALAQEAFRLAKGLGFVRGLGEAQNNQAAYQLLTGNADVALGLALEAIKLGERNHLDALLAESYSTIGNIYHSQMAYEKALNSLAAAERFNRLSGNPLIASKILNIRGSIARDQFKYDSAMISYKKALQVIDETHEVYRLPEVLNNIGVVYHRQKGKDQAMKYYFLGLKAAEQNQNKVAEGLTSANIGYTYLADKDFRKAKEYLMRSLRLSRDLGDRKNLPGTYMALMQLENERGDFNAAHQYMVDYYKLKDSLFNAEKNRQIAELEIRYETEKKEMTIQLLERQNKIQELWTDILIAVVLMLIISSVIIYFLQRNAENKNRRILNLEIDYLTSRHRELSEKFRSMLTNETKPAESVDQRLLRKAIDVVENNISDPLFGVERMGREMGMSRTNLHRKIKGITGFPPSELIRSIRLKKAASLLLNQTDSVSQISFAVGFEDQSYFSKSFKRQFGVPPSEYMGSLNRSAN